MEDKEWKVLLTLTDRMQAEMVKGLLASSGVPARLEGEALGMLYGLQTGPLAQVRVLVPATAFSLAREIIAQSPDTPGD